MISSARSSASSLPVAAPGESADGRERGPFSSPTMKIIHRYILLSVTGTFLITLLVLTGILCLGNLLKVADLILRGMDPALILQFFGFLVISLLEYAIPMAILTSAILVFGRLSADNEITGMRACGIGLKQIISPVILLGLILTLICLYLQNSAIPNYGFATRKLRARIGLQDPDALLQAGETIALPGYTINFARKEEGFLHQIQINQYDGQELASTIFARMAAVELDREVESFNLKLIDGTVEEIIDRANPQVRTTTTFGVLNYPISLEKLYASAQVSDEDKRKKDMTSNELLLLRRNLLEISAGTDQELSRLQEELDRREDAERKEAETVSGMMAAESILVTLSPDLRLPIYSSTLLNRRIPGPPPILRGLHRTVLAPALDRLRETTAERARILARAEQLRQDQLHRRQEISLCTTDFQKRLSLSAACLSMIFISIPLAIKTHRGEKTIGMALSLALLFVFYIFIAYADAVGGEPGKYPYLIVWMPNLLFAVVGGVWMVRFTRI